MRKNPGPGKFIVIEGLDGAGTTTQAELLAERLSERGSVWQTQEPTNRPAGQLIRQILTHDWKTDPRALALLFAADRVDHVYRDWGILDHLRRGVHVVCDRYYLSSMAYQTLDAGFDWVYRINDRVLRTDVMVFVEVPVVQCLERIGDRQGGRKELFEEQRALEKVRASYYQAMQRLGEQEAIQVVDGCGSIDQVAELVWNRVESLFEPDLLTNPKEQQRLAQTLGATFFPKFQQELLEGNNLFIRGLRQIDQGFEVQVHTPGDVRPALVQFSPQAGRFAVTVRAEPHERDRLEILVSNVLSSESA
jgi:dTMP kinase